MNGREYALQVLYRVNYEGAFASLLMRTMPKELSIEDRHLASEIVYGTLRNYTMLEYQWKDLASKSVRPKSAVLLNLSVYQLQYMDRIPPYAVIHEAVELASQRDRGFINALLRKVLDRGVRCPEGDWPTKEAIETSHPELILRMWEKQYGKETALRIAEVDQQRPVLYGRWNSLIEKGEETESYDWVDDTGFRIHDSEAIQSALKEGKILIQSRSSQQIAPLLDVSPGMRVWDVCAAPGTKSQQIACLMRNEGELLSTDLYSERVSLIDALMERTGVTIATTMVKDAAIHGEEDLGTFDRILIDAPCSGLGDLSHKPEIRFHITPESLDELVKTQAAILEACHDRLRAGGKLVYSTCTLNKKENEKQIQSFLQAHKDFELLFEHTYFPYELESDGFYAAVLKRN